MLMFATTRAARLVELNVTKRMPTTLAGNFEPEN
jgi:hypothetical protein